MNLPAAKPKQTTEHDRIVGARVKSLRKIRKFSQTELAEAVGVTYQQVQKYESGDNRIGAGRLMLISRFLEVPVSILFGDEGASEKEPETFEFFNVPGAADLLRAFVAIEHDEARREVLSIVRRVASISGRQSIE